MPAIDNMMLAAPDQPGERLVNAVFRPGKTRRREREVRERAMEMLEVFNLTRLADHYAGTLSVGGQLKLLELSQALMASPRFLLLDEPMAEINPTLGRRLLDHMQRLRTEEVTFLFIEHDMEVVMNRSTVVVMAEGRVMADSRPGAKRPGRDRRVPGCYRVSPDGGIGASGLEGRAHGGDGALLLTDGVVAGYLRGGHPERRLDPGEGGRDRR